MEVNENRESWVDAHCHLCIEPLAANYLDEIEQAENDNINVLISSALSRREIDWHLANQHPNVKLIAGIHPHYDKSNVNDLSYIAELCETGHIWGIGEVGFDNRRNNHNQQKNILYPQLELAARYDLPVIFHVVRRYNELYQTLRYDFPNVRGYIHGFNGSLEIVEMFSRLNIGFSIGYRIFQKRDVVRIIERILDNGMILLETDAPFQQNSLRNQNTDYLLGGVLSIAEKISELCSYPLDEILEKQWQTYQTMNERSKI